ncbi:Bug family tripartite tricarboxylate transporter substrate binding protein [Comamonas terrigena]|uniref:Bug family tripartite tricarboxylate transporter substrate binding protein n=1 Tax=Comamonas terrigena TaxID=32013 RepID=UPI00244714F9|nr:tripartite tricarboxylate transporter substrate binding protein [Comamonas terrigena]MDH0049064.1 tripartite tricarboxylate transporter substrate binding protein [Comamonas terrigena]MDH0513415.1 tripartite tricarboxylate transporter substrate binding protein [Comamonas terrigena]MDH1092910.1 tripartite tricarboxylate transporter substrate binding protein [Comamonas terrigena]MDH1292334.1 tripartite tricarboxylate transporter substrate binding protein [Comamonas terrigena]MDH1500544.1 tripa
MVRRSRVLRSLLALTAASLLASPLLAADNWPSKPIRLVVPYPPGGSSDIIARSIGQLISQELKQTVVIENKPGANGNLGAEFVARAQPDGYTWLLCDLGALAISPAVYTKLSFDPSKDLRGAAMLAYSPHMLVVHPSVQASNLQELVALSKKQDLNFAVTANGSAPHLAGVELARLTGAKWVYVPYKGGVQSVQDTVAGQTQVLMNGMLATYPHVQSGKLKLLGISKSTRMPLIADVPTLAEQGAQGFASGTWQGVVLPAKTPEAVVQRVNQVLLTAIRSPEVRARLTGQGAEVVTMTPTETDKFFNVERARWRTVVQTAQLQLD